MSLNVKDAETHRLVKELAALKGTSLTAAIRLAVKSEIDREHAHLKSLDKKPSKPSEILQAFAREFVGQAKNPADIHSWDIDKLLYDEHGLPK